MKSNVSSLTQTVNKINLENEITKLRDTEIDGIEPVNLSEVDFNCCDDVPTAEDMISLECVIHFED